MKKATSKQNIAIIVLSVLLLLSIIFGSTYSYFNGSSNELISGTVTTATLSVSISGSDDFGQATPFQLDTSGNKVIPGQPLYNTALQISNTSPAATYMIVVYSLNIIIDSTPVAAPASMDAMEIQESSVGSGWRRFSYLCKDTSSQIHAFVYLGDKDKNGNPCTSGEGYGVFPASVNGEPNTTLVLDADCLKVPNSWGNSMQGKTVSVNFTAYVIQADYLSQTYDDLDNIDVETRTSAIARVVIKEFDLDKTTPPTNP